MKKIRELKIFTQTKNSLIATAALVLSACAVGPDFKTPELIKDSAIDAKNPYSYTASPAATETEMSEGKVGIAQKLVTGRDIPSEWWQLFQSKELDELVRSALSRSPNLAAAQAALRAAQENANALSGQTLFPSVDANLGVQRNKVPVPVTPTAGTSGTSASLYSLYNASVVVSYTIDAFGLNKRAREDLQAEVEYRQFQVEAAYLALTTNLVTTAIQEASLRAQIKAQEEILQFQTKQLEVIESKFIVGAIRKVDVLDQRVLVAQTRAVLPGLEKALLQTRHQLAVYAGRLPSEPALPEFDLDSLHLPEELPVSIPSVLVRQRPDIRANEALLHRASAQVGVATASQYPQITLTGAYGSSALHSGDLFAKSAEAWQLAAALTQPIFNAGALSAKRRAAVALYDQAAANYRSTVLTSFQNVADSLRALEFDAKTLKQQVEVAAVAKQNQDLAIQQFRLGAIDSLTLLDVKRTYQNAQIDLVKAKAARYADTAALFQALGGGWWNRSGLEDISVKDQLSADLIQ